MPVGYALHSDSEPGCMSYTVKWVGCPDCKQVVEAAAVDLDMPLKLAEPDSV